MIRLFKDLIFAWRYKRAVKEAILLSQGSGLKYYVLYMNGGFKIVPKQTIKTLVKRHRFKKAPRLKTSNGVPCLLQSKEVHHVYNRG